MLHSPSHVSIAAMFVYLSYTSQYRAVEVKRLCVMPVVPGRGEASVPLLLAGSPARTILRGSPPVDFAMQHWQLPSQERLRRRGFLCSLQASHPLLCFLL